MEVIIMKSYKEYERVYIGSSDIASLTVVGPRNQGVSLAKSLDFNIDSNYFAYLVDGEANIGDHYKLVQCCKYWMNVFDDQELTLKLSAPTIKVYRAGDCGCIIQCLYE